MHRLSHHQHQNQQQLIQMTTSTTTCRCYTAYEELAEEYASGALHPGDLKPALTKQLNAILQPVSPGLLPPHLASSWGCQLGLHCLVLLGPLLAVLRCFVWC
jgi:hypothetical protein